MQDGDTSSMAAFRFSMKSPYPQAGKAQQQVETCKSACCGGIRVAIACFPRGPRFTSCEDNSDTSEGFEVNTFSVLACGVIVSLSLAANPVSADDGEPSQPQLEGAWRVEVTLRSYAPDCATAAIIGVGLNPFPSLNTFHSGGTMSEIGTRFSPSNRTPGHGVWRRRSNRNFEYNSEFFIFDFNGLLVATMEIRADLKLAPRAETFEGVWRLVRTDVSGNEAPFCATVIGERISL
jgi:hypothetical protein